MQEEDGTETRSLHNLLLWTILAMKGEDESPTNSVHMFEFGSAEPETGRSGEREEEWSTLVDETIETATEDNETTNSTQHEETYQACMRREKSSVVQSERRILESRETF